MKANEFVKKYGWFTAKECLAGATIFDGDLIVVVDADELNATVEAYDLVQSYIGRESGQWFFIADYCKKNRNNPFDSESYEKAKNTYLQAVEVVESCK